MCAVEWVSAGPHKAARPPSICRLTPAFSVLTKPSPGTSHPVFLGDRPGGWEDYVGKILRKFLHKCGILKNPGKLQKKTLKVV